MAAKSARIIGVARELWRGGIGKRDSRRMADMENEGPSAYVIERGGAARHREEASAVKRLY